MHLPVGLAAWAATACRWAVTQAGEGAGGHHQVQLPPATRRVERHRGHRSSTAAHRRARAKIAGRAAPGAAPTRRGPAPRRELAGDGHRRRRPRRPRGPAAASRSAGQCHARRVGGSSKPSQASARRMRALLPGAAAGRSRCAADSAPPRGRGRAAAAPARPPPRSGASSASPASPAELRACSRAAPRAPAPRSSSFPAAALFSQCTRRASSPSRSSRRPSRSPVPSFRWGLPASPTAAPSVAARGSPQAQAAARVDEQACPPRRARGVLAKSPSGKVVVTLTPGQLQRAPARRHEIRAHHALLARGQVAHAALAARGRVVLAQLQGEGGALAGAAPPAEGEGLAREGRLRAQPPDLEVPQAALGEHARDDDHAQAAARAPGRAGCCRC